MANYSQSQQNLYVSQQNGNARSRSSSPGPQFNQQQQQQLTPQQQQWMAQQYQQQYQQQKSMNDMMAQHQKQWAEHMAMTSQNNLLQQVPVSPQSSPGLQPQQPQNYGSAMNLNQNNNNNQYTAAQYAAWQRQYQQSGGAAISAMNMQQMQNYKLQQQRMAQMAQYQKQQQMQQMQQQQSQRALYQNAMKQQQQQNYYKSTGNLMNNNQNANAFQYQRQMAQSQNRLGDMRNNNNGRLDEEREESIDHQHESFVPPAPQSSQEIEKYVNWKAKRQGIDEKKAIDKEVVRQQKLAALEVEKNKDKNWNIASKKEVADFKQPLLENRSHKESDIDYELLNSNDGNQSGGCCCTVL